MSAGAVKRFIAAIEPWYDWGHSEVLRLDHHCRDFADESWGPARFFEIQWLGIHFQIQLGRTPRKIGDAEIAEIRLRREMRAAENEDVT